MTNLNDVIYSSEVIKVHKSIECKDGFNVSVQASSAHYSVDSDGNRIDFAFSSVKEPVLPWSLVEVGFPSETPEPWREWCDYADEPNEPTETVYAYVPVSMVRDLLDLHGGEK